MKILVKGVPSNVGALNEGTESAPKHLRDAQLIEKLSLNHDLVDLGDVVLPDNLIRHDVAPVRNWPSPRLVWEASANQLKGCFSESEFTIILGGGCSIFTGVFGEFYKTYKDQAKVISLDHHIDIKEPTPDICMGATAYTHWFLTSKNQWFKKPEAFTKESLVALGYSEKTITDGYDIKGLLGYSKEVISEIGIEKTLEGCLGHFRTSDKILVHLDLDVMAESDLQSVYMPSPDGMALESVKELLQGIVSDSRVLGMVITEFSGAHKKSQSDAHKVVDLIRNVLQ